MNKFNLTFSGKIQAGQDPEQVKLRFRQFFAIDDLARLERYFCGETVILRRNLDRKAAAQHYHELHLLGVVAELVKVTAKDAADAIVNAPATTKKPLDSPLRNKTDIAAQIKARKLESARLATEKVAQAKAAQEEAQRKSTQDNARQQAVTAAAASRKQAERAELKIRAAQEAARKQELKSEAKRTAAAEAANQKALRAQQKAERARLKAATTARRHAELAEIKRREIEEASRLQAELEHIKRQEAEEASRLQAELEQIKRQEVEAAARIKAQAQRKEANAQRQSAERRRAATEQLAAQRALRKEEKRQDATRKVEQKARHQQLQTEAIAHHKAQQPHRAKLEQQEHAALSVAPTADLVIPAPRKRESGEPNLYTLHPFRNTNEVRMRAAQAQQQMRRSYKLGAISLAALLIAGGIFLRHGADANITGATAMAINPHSAPLVLAGDRLLLHDRAGVSTREVPLSALGLSSMTAPLAFDSNGTLFALGQHIGDNTDTVGDQSPHLLRCELEPPSCEPFSPGLHNNNINAFVIHPLDGSVLVADSTAGELLKIDRAGQVVARAAVAIHPQPVLRLHGGLLLMNSADGPAISVVRYENKFFGQQLDEILLLPPSAQQTKQSTVGDFLWSSGTWWASLLNPASGSVGLYRFDGEWNYLDAVPLPDEVGPLQLLSWGERTVVNNPHRPAMQRFNAQGTIEAPFVSTPLAELVAGEQRRANLATMAWRVGLLLCALAAIMGCGLGYLQSLRRLVYKPQRERGAEPVDDYVDALHWINPAQNRLALLRRRSVSYGLLALGILCLAIGQSVTVWQLTALLLALSGPAIALLLLSRHPIGHIGVMQDKLLLVDHRGMYHLAGGSGVQYHGAFLLIDDVVVFSGSHLLPAFAAIPLQQLVRPLALNGVKVDRNTLVVKLLQGRHPFAQGACAIVAATTLATLLLFLHGIF